MCIGWPMQVLSPADAASVWPAAPGLAPGVADALEGPRSGDPVERVLARGRDRIEHIDLRLVGACAPGDWVLVYQGAARERLDAQRAAEIFAAIDLVEQGLAGADDLAEVDPGFALPSAMSAAQLAALTGGGAEAHAAQATLTLDATDAIDVTDVTDVANTTGANRATNVVHTPRIAPEPSLERP